MVNAIELDLNQSKQKEYEKSRISKARPVTHSTFGCYGCDNAGSADQCAECDSPSMGAGRYPIFNEPSFYMDFGID